MTKECSEDGREQAKWVIDLQSSKKMLTDSCARCLLATMHVCCREIRSSAQAVNTSRQHLHPSLGNEVRFVRVNFIQALVAVLVAAVNRRWYRRTRTRTAGQRRSSPSRVSCLVRRFTNVDGLWFCFVRLLWCVRGCSAALRCWQLRIVGPSQALHGVRANRRSAAIDRTASG